MQQRFTDSKPHLTLQTVASQSDVKPALLLLARKERNFRRLYRFCLSIAVPGSIAFFIGIGFVDRIGPVAIRSIALLSLFGLAISALVGIYAVNRWRSSLTDVIESLGMEAIVPLIEALPVREERQTAKIMLTHLLPMLHATDSGLLKARHRAILNKYLSQRGHFTDPTVSACLCAILKAYQQVGDSDAIPVVERLANGEGYAKTIKSVQQAAQECLPYLRERGPKEMQRQNLLRASAPEATAETLLRPAPPSVETAPEQLLRIVETRSGEPQE